MKKYIALILSCMLLVAQCSLVSASETEQYEMVEMNNDDIFTTSSQGEVAPCLMYIANIYTSIIKISSNQIGIRAETVCSETVKSITVTYTLQKWNGSQWVRVASKTASASNVAQTVKSYTITGVSSGRYRTKATASVTGYNGYTESLTGYSGSITIIDLMRRWFYTLTLQQFIFQKVRVSVIAEEQEATASAEVPCDGCF